MVLPHARLGTPLLAAFVSVAALACAAAPPDIASGVHDDPAPRGERATASPAPTSSAGGAAPPPVEVHRYPEGGGCLPYKDAEKMAASVTAANDDAFRAAVEAKGLQIVKLKATAVARAPGTLSGAHEPAWSVKSGLGATGQALFGPPSYASCGSPVDSGFDLAKDASGKLFWVQRQPKGTAERVLRVCGCESDLPPRGCGTAPQPIQWYFELPAGMTFGGEVAVTYPVESSRNDFAGRANGPCPAQVPLP